MIYFVLLAGGKGTRAKSSKVPKQFYEIDNKPIVIYPLETIMKIDRIDKLFVSITPGYEEYFNILLEKFNIKGKNIEIIPAVETRMASIKDIVDKIFQKNKIAADDIIIFQDAARPFVTVDIINRSIEVVKNKHACMTLVPAIDTIVRSMDGETIYDVPPKKTIYLAQTPEGFNLQKLGEGLKNIEKETLDTFTGISQIFEYNKWPIYINDGDTINFKITTDSDFKIAKSIIEQNMNDK